MKKVPFASLVYNQAFLVVLILFFQYLYLHFLIKSVTSFLSFNYSKSFSQNIPFELFILFRKFSVLLSRKRSILWFGIFWERFAL